MPENNTEKRVCDFETWQTVQDSKFANSVKNNHSLIGRSTAAIPAIKTVNTIVRVPAEISPRN